MAVYFPYTTRVTINEEIVVFSGETLPSVWTLAVFGAPQPELKLWLALWLACLLYRLHDELLKSEQWEITAWMPRTWV